METSKIEGYDKIGLSMFISPLEQRVVIQKVLNDLNLKINPSENIIKAGLCLRLKEELSKAGYHIMCYSQIINYIPIFNHMNAIWYGNANCDIKTNDYWWAQSSIHIHDSTQIQYDYGSRIAFCKWMIEVLDYYINSHSITQTFTIEAGL